MPLKNKKAGRTRPDDVNNAYVEKLFRGIIKNEMTKKSIKNVNIFLQVISDN